MILDNSLVFSSAQSLITNSTTASTNVIDLTGIGSGSAPNLNFGNATTFGADMGIGDGEAIPKVYVTLGTTFLTASSATLNIAVQGAPDNGSNVAGSWTTMSETGALAASVLLIGRQITLYLDTLALGQALPRFLRLSYQLPAATSFTAGSIGLAGIALQTDQSARLYQYPANFTVAA